MPKSSALMGVGAATKVLLNEKVQEGYAVRLNSYCTVKDMHVMGCAQTIERPAEVGKRHGLAFLGDATPPEVRWTAPQLHHHRLHHHCIYRRRYHLPGYIFSGCQMFYSKIVLEDSWGVVFEGMNFGKNMDISVKGGTLTMFSNSSFSNLPASIHVEDNPHVKFVNCFTRDEACLEVGL